MKEKKSSEMVSNHIISVDINSVISYNIILLTMSREKDRGGLFKRHKS